jgi:hypothetical protein
VATPIDTRNFREVAEEVRLGLLTGQSFGFTIKSDEWEGLDTDKPIRTITEIDQIFDVGPVTYPAYQDTTVALRSLEAAKETLPEPKTMIDLDGTAFTFDDAIKHIESLRSELSPTANDSDDADDDPTITKSPDETRDFFDKIEKLEKKHEVKS